MPVTTAPFLPPGLSPRRSSPEAGASNSQDTFTLVIPQTITQSEKEPEVRGVSSVQTQVSPEILLNDIIRLYTVEEDDMEDMPYIFEAETPKSESLNTRVDTLEIHFDWLTKRVEGLRQMLDDMRGDISWMQGKLDGLEKSPEFPGRLISTH
ncbi:hypothetical protein K438DRAFT_1979331 [Mycena galopus ATCC 62051]|nr:hypothetical protein K438DRAFT_1783341 [Mycena galopus ATCC 62051]KAF8176204.1 hypothetical protein K438DRAFT_1979331 [Mycena galopus ATCC 62051]